MTKLTNEQIEQILAEKDSKNNCTVDISNEHFIFSNLGWGSHDIDDLREILSLRQEVERLKNPWISVDDELPAKNNKVICKKQDGRFEVSWRCYDKRQEGNNAIFFHESEYCKGGLITHWMQLPKDKDHE